MKTVSKKEATHGFESLGELAHSGEVVLVTHGGKPWIKLVSATVPKHGKSATQIKARLDRISRKPIRGVNEVLKRLRD